MFSNLICYKNISKNTYGTRTTTTINRIIPHCFVGSPSVKRGTDVFSSKGYKWSCNYYIDADGNIGGVLPEEYISICTGSKAADKLAITVEMACKTTYPYEMTNKTIDAFVNLAIDICKRYNKNNTIWIKEKTKNKAYKPKTNELLISVHRFYALKSCPGDYCFNRLDNICSRITNGLVNTISENGLGIRTSKIGKIDFNNLDYSSVFDWKYYRNKYADLSKNGLNTQDDFTKHFKTCGLLEARQGNSTFNPIAYRNNNPDLNDIFGNDYEWYYAHYILCGKKEGRRTL